MFRHTRIVLYLVRLIRSLFALHKSVYENDIQTVFVMLSFPRHTETSTVLERVLSVVILLAVVLTVLDTEPNFQMQFGGWVKLIEFIIF